MNYSNIFNTIINFTDENCIDNEKNMINCKNDICLHIVFKQKSFYNLVNNTISISYVIMNLKNKIKYQNSFDEIDNNNLIANSDCFEVNDKNDEEYSFIF